MKAQTQDVSKDQLTQTKKKKPQKVKKPKEARDIRSVFRKALKGISLNNIKKPWMAQKAFKLITTPQELQAWADSVLNDTSRHKLINGILTPVIALDTEGTGLDTRILVDRVQKADGTWDLVYEVNVELAGICLSSDGTDGIYIPVTHEKTDLDLHIAADNIDRIKCAEILQYLFDRCHLVFYNAKFDREVMRLTMGINFRPYPHFEDVQVLAYINDPKADLGDKGKYTGSSGGLKALSKNVLGIEQIELEELAKVKCDFCPVTQSPFCSCTPEERKIHKHTLKNYYAPFPWIPTDLALWYAAGDAICTWLLWEKMHELAKSRWLIHRIDHELVESITWIERQRWIVDTQRLSRTVKGHSKKIGELREQLRALALESGYEETKQADGSVLEDDRFNPGSTMQLQTLFFKIKGYTVTKFTGAGNPSCDAEVLEDLFKLYPEDKFLQTIMQYRDYMALHPDNLKFDPRDHSARIYLKQNVVAGGRLAAAGGDFEVDGGFGLNPQGIKKVESYLMWKVQGNVLDPDPEEIANDDIVAYEVEDLHPSCFKDSEKEVVIGYKEKNCRVVPMPTPTSKKLLNYNDKQGHYEKEGLVAEAQFIALAPKFGLTASFNPEKDEDVTAPDLVVNGEIAELKHRETPRWYAERDYGFSNQTAISFDRGDYRAYSNLPYDLTIYLWVEWRTTSDYGKTVKPMGGVWKAKFSEIKKRIDSGEAKIYQNREEGSSGGETHVYGLNLDWFERVVKYDYSGATAATVEAEREPIVEKVKVRKVAPGIINNHIGKYMGYAVCLVPKCTSCVEKYGILIPDTKMDANEVINLRVLFHAPPGWTLFSVDYSNIEMRCAANVSGEPEFINEFLVGKGDFHSLTASKVFPEFTDPATSKAIRKSLRDLAKIINFALLYGGTEYTIFENMKKKKPDITWEEAKEMVAKYWAGVPVFFEFCKMKQDIAKEEMLCKTATGRVINFKSAMEAQHIHKPTEDEMSNYWKYRDLMKKSEAAKKQDDKEKAATYRAMADRQWKDPDSGVRNAMDYNKFMGKIQRVSVNVPLQGLAGDFMRMALNRIRKWIESDPLLQAVVHVHCSVHDEIDFIVKNEYVPFVMPRITRLMKLRKLHEKMGWKVGIEADAEYGHSWDVEHHVTGDDDHKAAAWTEIKEVATYLPDGWEVDTLKGLLRAMGSGEETRINKAKSFLQENLHPRAFTAAKTLFEAKDDKARKKALIAAIQLDEFWRIDSVPDDGDDKLEKLADFELRNELTSENRDPMTPEFGYLGAIPLTANVKRPTVQILGEEVAVEDVEVVVSADSITVSVSEPEQLVLNLSTDVLNLRTDEDEEEPETDPDPEPEEVATVEEEGEPEMEPVKPKAMAAAAGAIASPPEESVFFDAPVIRPKKVVEVVPEPEPVVQQSVIPDDGTPTYEVIDLDETTMVRLKARLGRGGNTIRILYRGKLATLVGKALAAIPEEYVVAVHGIPSVLKS